MTVTGPCAQPGCTGQIEDGYCNLCGMAPMAPDIAAKAASQRSARSAPATGPTGPTGPSGPGPLASARASARSAALSTARTSGTRRTASTRTRTSTRGHIGAGLVDVPEVPVPDPESVVLKNPQVDEGKRFCAKCGEAVGRGREGRPGRTEGFCGKCRHPFNFTPKLQKGDKVGGQYEVVGCLAHGGLGWIYLARDTHVSNRWVALKGLLDTGDADAMEAAMAERRFLASVEHPNIVKIYNFAEYEGLGYIVMEYVGGTSLKQLLKERREANGGKADPLPVAQAIAYMLEILPAMGYLHRMGLLFCDFKPDNVILQDDSLKLIDLGGVRRVDDPEGAIYGTVGFQAPEIADMGPSVSSDLYTVGRALAVLILDFKGYQSTYSTTLPSPQEQPLFAARDALYRFLFKACAPHPDDRFQSADEMAEQLIGVLREVVAAQEGTPKPSTSTLFSADQPGGRAARAEALDWRTLPSLKIDPGDQAATMLVDLAETPATEIEALLDRSPFKTVEVELRRAKARIERGEHAKAELVLASIAANDPWEWRVEWYRGLIALEQGDPPRAVGCFDRVYSAVPGELAPKLAIGVASEAAGDRPTAVRFYDVVSRTDDRYVTASFGLARCLTAAGDRNGAVAAYQRVPVTSSAFVDAQVAAAHVLIGRTQNSNPGAQELVKASATVERLVLASERRASLARDLLSAALDLVRTGAVPSSASVLVVGHPLQEPALRAGLEQAYRDLARLADTPAERIRLVDQANAVRPRSLL